MSAVQSALAAAGPQAERIAELMHFTAALCALVFVAVLAALAVALWRAPKPDAATPPDLSSLARPERGAIRGVASATIVSGLLLLVLIVASIATDRALARLSLADALNVQVTAHQWWWEVRYGDAQPSRMFTTANELHVPVGRPVLLTLSADDVIHSFWVPALAGKKDMIPGRTATLQLRVDREGVYRGQCAEFCGLQHAHMAFLVVAEPPERYEAWAERQRQGAPEPKDDLQRRGREVFLTNTCVMCHTIQGTTANARRAPDLTHVAGRQTLAAGTLPNGAGYLAGWVADPHGVKPGVNMPSNPLAPDDLQALLAYLGTLQ
jgi:cytochrome c oxidase subunit II